MKRFVLVVTLLLSLCASLRAQDVVRPQVQVAASGSSQTLTAMAGRISALEARLPIFIRWSELARIDVRDIVASPPTTQQTPRVLARVWLDLSHPERAVLFMTNARQDRFLVRVVPASGGDGELTRETLATVVESAIDALLAGAQIGLERAAAVREIEAQTGETIPAPVSPPVVVVAAAKPVPEPQPKILPAPTHPKILTLSAQYRGDALDDGPSLRHGVQLALSCRGFFKPSFDLLLAVTGHYFPPFALGDAGRRVNQHGGGARAALGATGSAGLFSWQTGLGAGVDLARVTPKIGADSGLTATDDLFVALPMGTAFVAVALRPKPWLELSLGAGVDVDFSGHHFDAQNSNDRTALISPWRAHPYWYLGLGTPLSGRAKR